ncbi:polyketide synthase, partial [bacterium]|nr:polyketide synthase [bacterium]
LAAVVEDSLFVNSGSALPRLHQMLDQALEEALEMVPWRPKIENKKTGVFLGCMSAEDTAGNVYLKARKQLLLEEITKDLDGPQDSQTSLKEVFENCFGESHPEMDAQKSFTNSLAAWVHQKLNTQGPALCLDSACASSLSALDVTVQYLRSGLVDVGISGGVEGNLGLEAFIPFSKLGVLSQGKSLPFDSRTDGIIQGEGAVVFVLQRLSDALQNDSPILGVIRGISCSSNGSKASLFSPSSEEQSRLSAINNKKYGTQDLIYIEGHGTGTRVGDEAELKALENSFSGKENPIYLGSVKALIGHTKGAAGAAALLKCLLSLKHRMIPPSPYFKQFPEGVPGKVLQINQAVLPFPLDAPAGVQMRVNSSGFGGANYQLVLSSFQDHLPESLETKKELPQLAVCGFSEVHFSSVSTEIQRYKWKIPPNQIAQLEVSQMAALVAVKAALEKSLIPVKALNPERTVVIYAGVSRSPGMESILESLGMRTLASVSEIHERVRAKMLELSREKHEFSENSCQAICSMVSGRIAQEFNLTGVNYHLDADFASSGYAFLQAQVLLQLQAADTVIVIASQEYPQNNPLLLNRERMQAWVLCTQDQAEAKDLPNLGTVELHP